MKKKNAVLHVFFLASLILALAVFATAQHEGHDPGATVRTSSDRLPGERGYEANCQRVARLAAELDEEFEALLDNPAAAELRTQLSRHKVKLQEFRAATEVCSQQCGRRLKRKGCGRMMRP